MGQSPFVNWAGRTRPSRSVAELKALVQQHRNAVFAPVKIDGNIVVKRLPVRFSPIGTITRGEIVAAGADGVFQTCPEATALAGDDRGFIFATQ